MQLLNQDQTKSDKDRSEAERTERIRKLNQEETAIARRVNEARENELKEKAVIETDLASFRVKASEEKKQIERDLAPFRLEVQNLEDRKRKALEPIEARELEVGRRETDVTAKEAITAEREAKVAEGQRNLVERTTALVEREEANAERTQELDRREERVKAEENTSRQSAENLAQKWADFHKAVANANRDLQAREKRVDDKEKALTAWSGELAIQDTKLGEERRRLQDGFETLARAKKEVEKGDREVERIK